MDLKNVLNGQKGLEILFKLKLEVLQGMIVDGSFHKEITNIKSLISDLAEIIKKYETKIVEEKA